MLYQHIRRKAADGEKVLCFYSLRCINNDVGQDLDKFLRDGDKLAGLMDCCTLPLSLTIGLLGQEWCLVILSKLFNPQLWSNEHEGVTQIFEVTKKKLFGAICSCVGHCYITVDPETNVSENRICLTKQMCHIMIFVPNCSMKRWKYSKGNVFFVYWIIWVEACTPRSTFLLMYLRIRIHRFVAGPCVCVACCLCKLMPPISRYSPHQTGNHDASGFN